MKARQPNSDAHGFYLQPYQGTSYPNFDVWFTLACNATTSLKCSQRAVASDLTFWISPEVTSAGSFCSVIQKIGIFGWHPGRLDAYDWHIDCTVPARDNIGSYTYIHNYDVYFEALTNGSDWQ